MTEIDYELANIRLIRSVFQPNPSFTGNIGGTLEKPTEITLSIKNSGDFRENNQIAHFSQRFRIEDSTLMPFTLEVEYGAVFKTHEPVPQDLHAKYISNIFPQVVFPFLREFVANLTVRGGFPPILLHMDSKSLRGEQKGSSEGPVPRPVVKWTH
jgi:hypothetical protein